MSKLQVGDLEKIKERARKVTVIREGAGRAKIAVHMGTCGIAAGARDIMITILEEIRKKDIKDILVMSSGCAGLCSREPMVTVELKGRAPVKYVELTSEKIQEIFDQHVLKEKIVKKYALAIGSERIF